MESQDHSREAAPVDRVTSAAEAIADGQTPDWTGLASTNGSDAEQAVLSDLRVIAAIANVYAAPPEVPGADDHSAVPDGPREWGPLIIRETIGHGRFGDVYRAWDPRLDREVALKLLKRRERASVDDTAVIEEGRLMARVRHPSVVTIYGADRVDGRTGLWMELIEGRTLAQELAERGPFPAGEIIAIGLTLCGAMQAVHRAGLLHRDIKASNVLRDAERGVLLGDFGTGSEVNETDVEGGARDLAGTPLYIAPEVLDGRAATPGSDLYSLGVLLFHLATASYPVRGRSLREVRLAHAHGHRTLVKDLAPDMPPALADVIERAIAPGAADRFEDADAMRRALAACQPAEPDAPPHWRGPAAIAAAFVAVVAALWFTVATRQVVVPSGSGDWVLVAAFDNRTSNPILDGTLGEMLQRELRASSALNIVPRERVNDALSLMQRPSDSLLDGEMAREVALRDGRIRWLVAGHIAATADGYDLVAHVIAPADGAVLTSVTERATGQPDLAPAVRRMALRLRERLGEPKASVRASGEPLQKVTTSSLQALQQYSRAARLWDQVPSLAQRSQTLAAMESLLRSALEFDPGFASAHILLAVALDWGRNRTPKWDEVLSHADQAVSFARSVRDGERLFIEATSYRLQADAPGRSEARTALQQQAIKAYERLLGAEPDYLWGYSDLSRLYRDTGRPADQIRTLLRLGVVRPHGVAWRAEAARVAYMAGDLEAAQELARGVPERLPQSEMEARPLDVAWVTLLPAHLAWLDDDAVGALRLVDAVAGELASVPAGVRWQFAGQLLNMYLTLGRLRQAETVNEWLPQTPDDVQFRNRATLAAEHGQVEMLRGLLAGATPAQKALVPSLLLAAGLLDDWRQWNATGGATRAVPIQDGRFAFAEGRLDSAVEILDAIPETEPNYNSYLQAQLTLAAAWRAKGDVERAIDVLESATSIPRWRTSTSWSLGWVWIKLRTELADLYRAAGRIENARVVENHLRQLMAVADEDHPVRVKLDSLAGR